MIQARLLALALSADPAAIDAEPNDERAESLDSSVSSAGTDELEVAADAAFAAGRHELAAQLYAELHDQRPDPGYLYSRAQAQRLAGHDGAATETYAQFIKDAESVLPALEANQRSQLSLMVLNARKKAAECQARLDAEPEPRPAPEPVPGPVPEPRPAPPPEPRVTDPPQLPPDAPTPVDWRRDPAAIALVGVGGAAILTGAAMLIAAELIDNRADDQDTHEAFRDDVSTAQTVQRIAPAPLAIGGALVIGGVVRYLVVRRRGQRRASARILVGPRSASAGLRVEF